MEVNNQLVSLKDVNAPEVDKIEFGADAIKKGFDNTVNTGLGRSYSYIDGKLNNDVIKALPDYGDNSESYDSYLFLPPNHKIKYLEAVKNGDYVLNEDGDVVAGEGNSIFNRMLSNAGAFMDDGALKGAILAQNNGVNQEMMDAKFQEVHTKNLKLNEGQRFTTGGSAANMLGALGAYMTDPETALEIFGVPSRIYNATIGKGIAKAFGIEFAVGSIAEGVRQWKPDGIAAMNKRAKIDYTLTDGATQVLINAGLAGSIRAFGSGVSDTLLLRQIEKDIAKKGLTDTSGQIFKRWNERQLSKTIGNKKAYNFAMRHLSDSIDEGKIPDIPTDIDIAAKADPEIEAVSIHEEHRASNRDAGYQQAGKDFDEEIDEAVDAPEDLKFEDDVVDNFNDLEPEILNDPEVQQLKKELDELDNPNIVQDVVAKSGDNIAAGAIAGTEMDDEGNITFDPVKAAAGAIGYQAVKKVAPKLFREDIKQSGIKLGSTGGGDTVNIKPNTSENVSVFRGTSIDADGTGESLMGKGLYLTPSEVTAKSYGDTVSKATIKNDNLFDATKIISDEEYKGFLDMFKGVRGIEHMPDENIEYTYQFLKDDIGANTGIEYEEVAEKMNEYIKSKNYDGMFYDLSSVSDSAADGEKAFLLFNDKNIIDDLSILEPPKDLPTSLNKAPAPAALVEAASKGDKESFDILAKEVFGRTFEMIANKNTGDQLKPMVLDKLIENPNIVEELAAKFGYTMKYFSSNPDNVGRKIGNTTVEARPSNRSKLKKQGYSAGNIWVYDPYDVHGAFDDPEYTKAWRGVHELAHGITERVMQAKYGDSRRFGALGNDTRNPYDANDPRRYKALTAEEGQRAIEWEDVAFRTQLKFYDMLGIKVDEKQAVNDFNIAGSDTIIRTLTGDFADPADYGVLPRADDYRVDVKDVLELIQNQENEIAADQGRTPTRGIDLDTWEPVSDNELLDLINDNLDQPLTQPTKTDGDLLMRIEAVAGESIDPDEKAIIQSLSEADQKDYLKSMHEALTDQAGHSIIAKKLGIKSGGSSYTTGVWLGETNPVLQLEIKPEVDVNGHLTKEFKTKLDDMAEMYAVALKQDGVGWNMPYHKSADMVDQNAIEFVTGKQLPNETVGILSEKLGDVAAIVTTKDGARFLNISDLSDSEFIKIVEKEIHNISDVGDVNYYTADSNFIEGKANDTITKNSLKRRSDLQEWFNNNVIKQKERVTKRFKNKSKK